MPNRRTLKHVTLIISVSFFITLLFFFVEEARYSLDFLADIRELSMLWFFTMFFACPPVAIHGIMSDRNNRSAFTFSYLGFLPPLLMLFWLL